jgi:hypothetical protein
MLTNHPILYSNKENMSIYFQKNDPPFFCFLWHEYCHEKPKLNDHIITT